MEGFTFYHLRPEFRGDMLGDKGVSGLDLREVRHGGGLQSGQDLVRMQEIRRIVIGRGLGGLMMKIDGDTMAFT